MSTVFEKKITKHANEIFGGEPLNGHRERFAEKLASQKESNKRIPIRKIVTYVTAIAAVLTGVVLFTQIPKPGTENGDSLIDVQNYYAMQFENKVLEIEGLLEQVDNKNKVIILSDIQMMKTETAITIQTAEEENIPFVVGLYSSKMEALEHIRHILQ